MAKLVSLRPELAEILKRRTRRATVGEDDGDEDWVDLLKDEEDALDFVRGKLLQIEIPHRRSSGPAYVRIEKVFERNKSGLLCSYEFAGASTPALSKLLQSTACI
eukprot:715211-Karenia_brevis.AAC.1